MNQTELKNLIEGLEKEGKSPIEIYNFLTEEYSFETAEQAKSKKLIRGFDDQPVYALEDSAKTRETDSEPQFPISGFLMILLGVFRLSIGGNPMWGTILIIYGVARIIIYLGANNR
jgi:hypothetical protein